MSFYSPEASLINYRIAVVASNSRDLASLFESWAMEIEADLKPELRTNMRYVANFADQGPGSKAWLSATLGSRGTLGLRLTLIGYNAAIAAPKDEILRRLDGLWVWVGDEAKPLETAELLRMGSSSTPIEIPTMLMFAEPGGSFLEKALSLWSKRQVQPSKTHFGRENSLRKGLEWALSFS